MVASGLVNIMSHRNVARQHKLHSRVRPREDTDGVLRYVNARPAWMDVTVVERSKKTIENGVGVGQSICSIVSASRILVGYYLHLVFASRILVGYY